MATSSAPSATRYRWAAAGDVNAFFGLMLDNVMNLVILAGILIGVFGFPREIVYTRMFPGTAFGVLVGDLVYTWLAFRLARREGRSIIYAADFEKMGALLQFLTKDCCGGRPEICAPLAATVNACCPPKKRHA